MGEASGLLDYAWFTKWTFMLTPERKRGRAGGVKRTRPGFFSFFLIRAKATFRDQGKHVGAHA